MNDYIISGKELLKMLINNGFEAYFIGDAVRDTILEKEITRIDITTIATCDSIKRVFKNCEIEDLDDNSVKILYNNFDFYVHTFMVSDGSDNNTLLNKHYSKNLLDDLANRDFTINAIAMSHSGKLTDAYDGYRDIMRKRIAHIGNAKIRFSKNPSLMIKAFALVSELNYKIVSKTKKEIKRRRKNLESVDVATYYEYLYRIFEGPYAKKAVALMIDTNIQKSIPSLKWALSYLCDHYKKVSIEELLLMAFVHSGHIDDRYQPFIKNFSSFVNIFTLACTNRYAKYDSMTLFANGLDISLEANRINYLLGKTKIKEKKIRKQWDSLPIKRVCDLAYKGQDLMKIISKDDYPLISDIIDDLLLDVLNQEIPNNHDDIEKRALALLTQKGIKYDLDGMYDFDQVIEETRQAFEEQNPEETEPVVEEDSKPFNNSEDYTNYRLDRLEQKLEEQAKLLEERALQMSEMQDLKLKNDIDLLSTKSIEFLSNNENLKYLIKNQEEFKTKLGDFIFDYIKNEDKNEEN